MKTLFCTVPVSSFFSIKPALEPNFGASEIVGVLKDSNIDVVHLDLNARLNAYKYANKDNEEGIMEVSADGLAVLTFKNSEYASKYYMVQTNVN